jgi:2-polyprenyl-3-methyl-5-hydroxy-6-metoxy-1,4-benzoquinol methylase
MKKNFQKLARASTKIIERIRPDRILGISFIKHLNKKESEQATFRGFNERPVEYRFVFEQISVHYPHTILDVGPGVTALPALMRTCGPLVSAIDNIVDYWPRGMFNRHYHILNDDIVHPTLQQEFDMVTCVSTLEHIENFNDAVTSMFNLIKHGGYLILTFPYTDDNFVDDVYALPASNAYIKRPVYKAHSYSRKELECWAKANNAEIVQQEYWQFWTGKQWTIGDRLPLPKRVTKGDLHQHSCVVFQKH